MKNKIFKYLTVAVITAFFTSCNSDEEVASIVQIAKPTMTIEAAANPTLTEGSIYTVTFNLSAPVSEDFNVYVLRLNSSTADDMDSDVSSQSGVSFQKTINIPAFSTTFSADIEIANDDLTEGNETLVLQIGDSRTSAVVFQPINRTITIQNVVQDQLVLSFNLDKTFTGDGGYSNTLCEVEATSGEPYDIDFLLINSTGNDTGNLTAQTGKCVEELTIDLADPTVTDGLYTVFAFVFTNADLDLAANSSTNPVVVIPEFTIPISVDYLRSGAIDAGTYNQEEQFYLTSAAPEGSATPVVDVLISTVNGKRIFTIQSSTGTVAASGKFAPKKKARK